MKGLLFLVNYVCILQISNLTNRFWSAVDPNMLLPWTVERREEWMVIYGAVKCILWFSATGRFCEGKCDSCIANVWDL